MRKIVKKIVTMVVLLGIITSVLGCGLNAFATENDCEKFIERIVRDEKIFSESQLADNQITDQVSNQISTQGVNEFDFLKNYLIENGSYNASSGIYYLFAQYYSQGDLYQFIIAYSLSSGRLYCGGVYFDGVLSAFLYLDQDSGDGYTVATIFDGDNDIIGSGTVYPSMYPYDVNFTLIDQSGQYVEDSLVEDNFNLSLELLVTRSNSLMQNEATINLGNFGFTKMFTPAYIDFSPTCYLVSYDANGGTGAPATQIKEQGKTLILSSTVPVREGYEFLGWSTSRYATTPTYYPNDTFTINGSVTLYAVWALDEDADDPADELTENPEEYNNVTVKIVNNPGVLTVDRYTDVVMTASAENMPEGSYIAWFVNGQQVNYGEISSFRLQCTAVVECDVTVKICDADGNILLDEDGNEISDTEVVITKGGLFVSIIGFFKKIFGLNRIYQ